jgi:hypothetical protein
LTIKEISMDFEALIKREIGKDDNGNHAIYYREALEWAYEKYKILNRMDLMAHLQAARQRHKDSFGSHESVASCVVIRELLEDFNTGL